MAGCFFSKDVKDIIIVGAGPCGLATAARLYEETPSHLFTDEEHQRYHWIRRWKDNSRRSAHPSHAELSNNGRSITKHVVGPDVEPSGNNSKLSLTVIDASAPRWMSRWDHLFDSLNITHLRSPMFFHVDPRDRDGLLAFAHAEGRHSELQEIRGCVGKEISKHKRKRKIGQNRKCDRAGLAIDERDRKDYFVPSHSLFKKHCRSVINRYDLADEESLIKHESVQDIDYDIFSSLSPNIRIFKVQTDKATHFSRAVVLAIGAGHSPSRPKRQSHPPPPATEAEGTASGLCHSYNLTRDDFPAPQVRSRVAKGVPTGVIVLGGGLTAAQVAHRAITEGGVTKVWMITRSQLKVKPFDIELAWVGKFKNHEKAKFWSADDDNERLAQIRTARNGGSIPPRWLKILKQHMTSGRLTLHSNTTLDLSNSTFDSQSQTWQSIDTSPRIPDFPPSPDPALRATPVNHIYTATGPPTTPFTNLPFLQTLAHKHPLPAQVGGLPSLTDDLMWRDDVPLFATGAMAALRLGPGAANLEGARLGAERVAGGVQEWFRRCGASEACGRELLAGEDSDEEEMGLRYCVGQGSRFQVLALRSRG